MLINKNTWLRFLLLALVAVPLTATNSVAGGFAIDIEAPASSTGEMKGAVILVRTYGCHQPWDAAVTATAEGIVDGKRQSKAVELARTSQGVYAIKQQWPLKGSWVITVTARYNGHDSSALVQLGADGKVRIVKDNRVASKIVPRKLTAQEIDAALNSMSNKAT